MDNVSPICRVVLWLTAAKVRTVTSYRHQLEAFVDKVRGREPQHWVSGEDSVANLHWIEQIYHKVSKNLIAVFGA
jgi:hypothetical protein